MLLVAWKQDWLFYEFRFIRQSVDIITVEEYESATRQHSRIIDL